MRVEWVSSELRASLEFAVKKKTVVVIQGITATVFVDWKCFLVIAVGLILVCHLVRGVHPAGP